MDLSYRSGNYILWNYVCIYIYVYVYVYVINMNTVHQ
jgi:hypothetical protein